MSEAKTKMRLESWYRFAAGKWGTFILCVSFTVLMIRRWVFPLGSIWFRNGNVMDDPAASVWGLWHFNESVLAGRNPYFTQSIFYPAGAHVLHPLSAEGFFPLTFLAKIITGGSAMYPFYAYRITILACFVLLLYFSYRFLRSVGMTGLASAIAATAFAFHRFYIDHSPHLSILAGFFIPLTALLLVRLYRAPNRSNLLITAIMMGLALYFTEFLFYILLGAGSLAIAMAIFADSQRELAEKLRDLGWRQISFAILLFALIIAPAVYKQLASHVLKPLPIESSNLSANLAALFIPNPQRTPLYGSVFSTLTSKPIIGVGSHEIFIGFPLLLFGIVGLVATRQRLIRIAAALSLVFFVLSLGPTLKVFGSDTGVPMPYALLMKVPPFDLSRTPARLVSIALFFLMIVASAGVSWIQRSISRQRGRTLSVVAVLFVFVWTAAEAYTPPHPQAKFLPPPELKAIVAGPVINLPLSRFDGYALLLQVFHHQTIATGYTSRYSVEQIDQANSLSKIVDRGGPQLCAELRRAGFRNIIVAPLTRLEAPFDLAGCSLNVIDLRKPVSNLSNYTFGTRIDLSQSEANRFLFYGWSDREPTSRWTDRGRAIVAFKLDQVTATKLRFSAGPFLAPGKLNAQHVTIKLNDRELATLVLNEAAFQEYTIPLPAGALQNENVLSFEIPDADSPRNAGAGEDYRLLGINVQWIEID